MRIEIEIPKEFEGHFKQDRFEDSLHRLSADAHLIAGNYEKETAIMLIKAFKESKPTYDVEKVITEMEEYEYSHLIEHNSDQIKHCVEHRECGGEDCFLCLWEKAKQFVRNGVKE